MNIEIGYRPGQSLAKVTLSPGESMQTESGGMMSGLQRMFGGESFFRNTFTAQNGLGEVLLAQALCGDMALLDMTPNGYFVQSSSFIASTPNVRLDTKIGGFKSFFGGEGMFVLKATAATPGQLLVGAFGGIEELACDGSLVIDTGHLVAWDAALDYQVGKSAEGWIASFLSGEGLVCHFRGQGRIWIQSRNPSEYGGYVGRRLPPRKA